MFLSVFDIFKLGVGPSSSHTMGPMTAAARFLDDLRGGAEKIPGAGRLARLGASVHGSLAFTGKAMPPTALWCWGSWAFAPTRWTPTRLRRWGPQSVKVGASRRRGWVIWPLIPNAIWCSTMAPLPGHAKGLGLRAFDERGNPYLTQTYYSVGGGFVVTAAELEASKSGNLHAQKAAKGYPHPFGNALEMLAMGQATGLTHGDMKRANEVVHSGPGLEERLDTLWQAMDACIARGLRKDGILPGGLKIKRRAKAIHEQLLAERGQNQSQPHVVNDWLSVYAMAVNEENAAGGRVVTSPTNGAAGVVPAVIRYYRDHCIGATHAGIHQFLLTAAAIGGLMKHNASISGAEVGCQGEVGSAAAMAAGQCAALGGTNEQVDNAAEIALEHHLGMTCVPTAGALHRAQRSGRDQGGLCRQSCPAWRWHAFHACGQLHRDDAPDRHRHECEVHGNLDRGPCRQSARVLRSGGAPFRARASRAMIAITNPDRTSAAPSRKSLVSVSSENTTH